MKIGDLVSFKYPVNLKKKSSTKAHDPNPRVLVLHDNWQGLVHGLNFNYLSDAEINMIRSILSPKFQLKHIAALARSNPLLVKEFDQIMEQAGSTLITSPQDFYSKAIKPFISKRGWDPYRRYNPSKMSNVVVVEPYSAMAGEDGDEEGLFKKFMKKFTPFRGPRI